MQLHHVIEGRGPRLVLLAPVGVDHAFMEPLAAELRSSFTILRADVRNHGRSVGPPAHNLHELAEDVHETVAART